MIPADLEPEPGAERSPQPLSPRQTWDVLGGVRRGWSPTRIVRAIDVTSALRRLRPDLPQASCVAAIHIGLLPFLFASRSKQSHLQRQIIAAETPLVSQGFTHLLITGPFVVEANRRGRLTALYAFQNHAWYAILFRGLYHLVISARLLLPLGLTDIRRANLKQKRANARAGFRFSVVFELHQRAPKP